MEKEQIGWLSGDGEGLGSRLILFLATRIPTFYNSVSCNLLCAKSVELCIQQSSTSMENCRPHKDHLQKGRWEYYCKYIEQNYFSYFLCMYGRPLAVVAWSDFQEVIAARWPQLVCWIQSRSYNNSALYYLNNIKSLPLMQTLHYRGLNVWQNVTMTVWQTSILKILYSIYSKSRHVSIWLQQSTVILTVCNWL